MRMNRAQTLFLELLRAGLWGVVAVEGDDDAVGYDASED